jgi:hypothetical protein
MTSKQGATRGGTGRAGGLNLMVNQVHSKRYYWRRGVQHNADDRWDARSRSRDDQVIFAFLSRYYAVSIMIGFSEYHKAMKQSEMCESYPILAFDSCHNRDPEQKKFLHTCIGGPHPAHQRCIVAQYGRRGHAHGMPRSWPVVINDKKSMKLR